MIVQGKPTMEASSIRKMIQAMPQFRERLSRLSLHIFLSSEIKAATNSRHLTDIGELEEDLVYGCKSSKELINFLAGAIGPWGVKVLPWWHDCRSYWLLRTAHWFQINPGER